MKAAREEAKQGKKEEGISIGSVRVKHGKIIGRGHIRRLQDNDPIRESTVIVCPVQGE